MRIGIPREGAPGETRVALTPTMVPALTRDGHDVYVQRDAGASAHFSDDHYIASGARIVATTAALYERAEALCCVQPPATEARAGDGGDRAHEPVRPREGSVLIGMLDPLEHPDLVNEWLRRHITSYALEFIPRIARAQSMDALTSMATVAGYKAALLAADRLDKLFPLLMTAAGTVAPATVLVLGAGIAGLQAIATAGRLGARVIAFDPRPAAREQVQSLGAHCLDMAMPENPETTGGYAREQSAAFLEAERAAIAARLPEVDALICAAQVFGKRAPALVTAEMVARMRPGGVIVDLAADQGGNCALTRVGQEIERNGVLIIGAGNLPALVPADASLLYAHNVVSFIRYLYPASGAAPDLSDEIVSATCVTREGRIASEVVRAALPQTQEVMA